MRSIPGHARAITIPVLIVLVVIMLVMHGWKEVLGAFLAVSGLFVADQTTHLAQADHSAPPPTWVERAMQSNRWLCTLLGGLLAIAGFLLVAA